MEGHDKEGKTPENNCHSAVPPPLPSLTSHDFQGDGALHSFGDGDCDDMVIRERMQHLHHGPLLVIAMVRVLASCLLSHDGALDPS